MGIFRVPPFVGVIGAGVGVDGLGVSGSGVETSSSLFLRKQPVVKIKAINAKSKRFITFPQYLEIIVKLKDNAVYPFVEFNAVDIVMGFFKRDVVQPFAVSGIFWVFKPFIHISAARVIGGYG